MSNDNQFVFWGLQDFSIGLRWTDEPGVIEVKLAPTGMKFVWGQAYPGPGVRVSAVQALTWLAHNWIRIAKDFTSAELRDRLSDGEYEMAAGFGIPDQPKVTIVTSGRRIGVKADGNERWYGSESIMIAEILIAFGNEIARHLMAHPAENSRFAVSAWWFASKLTDILPWKAETAPVAADEVEDPSLYLLEKMTEATFYCRRLGLDLDGVIRASAYLLLEHVRHALGKGLPRMTLNASINDAMRKNIPSFAELEASATPDVLATVQRGAGQPTWATFLATALEQRIPELRYELYYRDWPRRRGA